MVPTERLDVSGLGYADYRRAEARVPRTPLQQLLDHVARQAGRRVRAQDLTLSTADALDIETRTKDFVWLVSGGGAPADRLWKMWLRDSRPFVSLALRRGEALIENQQNDLPRAST
jgi:hypothetical protein